MCFSLLLLVDECSEYSAISSAAMSESESITDSAILSSVFLEVFPKHACTWAGYIHFARELN